MIVSASSGKTVNMRADPSLSGQLICTVPIGTSVDATVYNSEWYKIKYNGQEGYMMAKFLKENTSVSRAELQNIYNSLKEALALIDKALK